MKANFVIWSYEACNNNDKLVIENLVTGPKYLAKVFPGQSRYCSEVLIGPKCATGRSMLGAKVGV